MTAKDGQSDIITSANLSRYLPRGRADNVICLDSVDSTNNYLKKLAIDGAPAGSVVLAESQTAGRGRMGRSFASPKSKGIYMSALLRPQNATNEELSCITAWVAVAVHNAVTAACGVSTGIKWVNDLTLGNKKLCGILTETSIDSTTGNIQYIIVGVGVNVNETAEDFPAEFRDVATSLREFGGKKFDRNLLAAEMIKALDKLACDLPRNKQEYLNAYREHSVTVGKEVRLISGDSESRAFAKAIDDDFALVVETADGKQKTVHSGEVSVRGLYGYL